MAGLFIIMVMLAFFLVLSYLGDIWRWVHTKDEVKTVDQWNRFRKFGEENRDFD